MNLSLRALSTSLLPKPTSFSIRAECPEGWVDLEGDCFFLSTDTATFEQTEGKCVEQGGHLASCMSPPQVKALMTYLRKEDRYGDYYIGMNLEGDTLPRYSDGSLVNTDEITIEPTYNHPLALMARCYRTRYGDLYQKPCYTATKYLCKQGPTACYNKNQCEAGWLEKDGQCYIYSKVREAVPEGEAEAYCEGKGAGLATIKSQTDLTLLLNEIWPSTRSEKTYYLGGTLHFVVKSPRLTLFNTLILKSRVRIGISHRMDKWRPY